MKFFPSLSEHETEVDVIIEFLGEVAIPYRAAHWAEDRIEIVTERAAEHRFRLEDVFQLLGILSGTETHENHMAGRGFVLRLQLACQHLVSRQLQIAHPRERQLLLEVMPMPLAAHDITDDERHIVGENESAV